MMRLNDDALRAVLVRMSFTWYGPLRTTCRRLRKALSREIWTARRAAGIEESTLVVMVKPAVRDGGNPGLDNAYFVPRGGGGWVQLPRPPTFPEKRDVFPDVGDGFLYLRHSSGNGDPTPKWLTWSPLSWDWRELDGDADPGCWFRSVPSPTGDEHDVAVGSHDDRHC